MKLTKNFIGIDDRLKCVEFVKKSYEKEKSAGTIGHFRKFNIILSRSYKNIKCAFWICLFNNWLDNFGG